VLSSSLTNFMPIGGDLVLAEVIAPDFVVGKSVIEGDLRNTRHINVVAVKYASEMDSSGSQSAIFRNLDTKYRFKDGDVLLVRAKRTMFSSFQVFKRLSNMKKKEPRR